MSFDDHARRAGLRLCVSEKIKDGVYITAERIAGSDLFRFFGALAKINPQFYWGKKKHFSK